jgi:hypothetical protein
MTAVSDHRVFPLVVVGVLAMMNLSGAATEESGPASAGPACPAPTPANKATLIYRRAGNLRAVRLLLCHTKIESTVRYLGIEVDDALAIAEQIDV